VWVIHGEQGLGWITSIDLSRPNAPMEGGRLDFPGAAVAMHSLGAGRVLVQDRTAPNTGFEALDEGGSAERGFSATPAGARFEVFC